LLAGYIPSPGKIELVEVEEPQLTPAAELAGKTPEIIFQPECTCLCGSDLPFFDGNELPFPQKVGQSLHELIGSVVETNGTKFKPGDRVLCVPYDHFGLFERFVIGEDRAILVDDRVPEEQALMAQPLGTVLCALKKVDTVLDRDVVVIGQGPMGQLFNAAVNNMGARQVIGIDLLESRLEVSSKMGATSVICNANSDPISAVADLTDGKMADIVIEVVGHQNQALNLCIDLCRYQGKILYFGVPPKTINDVRWYDLFLKNLTVHTSVYPEFDRDFPLAMRWVGEKRIDVSPLITHRFPLAEIQTAFETFRDKKDGAVKVLVDFPSSKR
jgi:threonine dehydrogenase-like Zn-dependent dehydrogenase